MIRIGIIEDNSTIRERLRKYFNASNDFECIIAVDSVEKFIRLHNTNFEIDIILLDIQLNGMSGIDGIPYLRRLDADWEIIIFTVHHEADLIFKAISAGATGYLLKDLNQDELEQKLLSIQDKGGSLLSPQVARRVLDYFQPNTQKRKKEQIPLQEKELQIIRFLVDGLSYQEVADKIGISLNGVRYHIKNIYKKLQVRSKAEVIKKYLDGEI